MKHRVAQYLSTVITLLHRVSVALIQMLYGNTYKRRVKIVQLSERRSRKISCIAKEQCALFTICVAKRRNSDVVLLHGKPLDEMSLQVYFPSAQELDAARVMQEPEPQPQPLKSWVHE